MSKPALRIAGPNDYDDDVGERVVRALQDSALFVFTFSCLTDDPEQPDTEACILLAVTAVTDGSRGFLVMTDDFAPPRTDLEFAELMEGVYDGAPRGDDYVCRVATIFETDERTPGMLDLTDPTAARSVIESAYQKAFAGKPAIDHGALFEHLARFNIEPSDEASERERLIEFDGIGPMPSDSVV